jgi:hypothetical protein
MNAATKLANERPIIRSRNEKMLGSFTTAHPLYPSSSMKLALLLQVKLDGAGRLHHASRFFAANKRSS